MLAFAILLTMVRERDRTAVRATAAADALSASQRRFVGEMQRILLPRRAIPVRGIEVASTYVVGGQADEPIGGDWFAFVPVAPHALGVAIGDVIGHGSDAVAAMVEYRFTLRIVAGDGCEPATALRRLWQGLRIYGEETPCTALYGILDVEAATWSFASAGHLPPLIARANGDVQVLDGVHGRMFNPVTEGEYSTITVDVRPGDVIALYTDGLVERRGESIDTGIARLANRLTTSVDGDLSPAAATIVQALVGDTPADDVALVLLRVVAT